MSFIKAIHLLLFLEDDIMEGNGLLTIKEASIMACVCESTIYRYIRQKKLSCQAVQSNRKKIAKVPKSELISVFSLSSSQCRAVPGNILKDSKQCQEVPGNARQITKDEIREVMQEFFETKKAELVKPMEDQAIYRLGRIEQENLFLKQKLETILQENLELQAQVKVLPDLEQMKTQTAEANKKLQERETEVREQNIKIHFLEEEISQGKKKLEENHQQELEQVKKQAEEDQKTIVDAWKKELENAKKPWWKIW